ncbi:hypothetical protein XENOCAPTIV_003432, partial [Xenoophorus captivus]
ASHTHDAIAEAAQLMKEAVDDMMVTLNEAASEVGMVGGMVESIAEAMAKAGNKGTQACITAASAVSGIIADLDTTIMFASAGTLNAENDESFADHRENILKTAKALVEDTKLLVSGAASGQDKLAQAAQSSAKTITQLTDVVKLGAASIGSDDPETQVTSSFSLLK